MEVVKKIKKDNVCKVLQEQYSMICFSSFEERCLTVPQAVRTCMISQIYVILNVSDSSTSQNWENAKLICKDFNEAEIVEINVDDPIAVADKFLKIIQELIEQKMINLLIDVSTFTHETLLIMLRLLYDNNRFFNITCLYNGASSYSIGDRPEQVWLSKGCRDVRNVIGYPGILKPSLKTHVIVLAGFEIERVTGLVEVLEPDILSIGQGFEPTDIKHEDSMRYFKEKFLLWKNTFQNTATKTFEFSCCNIEKTINLLTDIVENESEMNYILVPLNTKLSTLAVGLYALVNLNIQVCYAIPEIYNSLGYSKPSDNITVVKLSEFKQFQRGKMDNESNSTKM